MLAGIILVLLLGSCQSAILITEIMYHPRQYSDYFQYLEIFNNETTPVVLTGWTIKAINYTFPSTTIQGNSYMVIARNPEKLRWAYPTLTAAQVLGPFGNGSALAESGENVKLVNSSNVTVFQVDYGVDGNWPVLANGFGASLELICYVSDDFDHSNLWSASVVPVSSDPHLEFGGSPGTVGRWQQCLYEKYPDPMIRFSEVHYNPYKTDWYQEVFEFIELKNNNTLMVDVSGWRLASQGGRGPMRYTFPAGTTLNPGEIITVVKNKTAFARVYPGAPGRIFGPYDGELPNQQTIVALIDANGRGVEYLEYDTSGSFPRAADALGGDNSTLPYDSPFMAPVPSTPKYFDIPSSFEFKGMSLTRRSWAFDTDYGYTWYAASPSPGKDNLDPDTPLLPKITKSSQSPAKKDIQPGNAVNVSINIRPWAIQGNLSSIPAYRSIVVTYWKYVFLTGTNGPRTNISMTFDGSDGFYATIPGQVANTFIRYTYTINWADGRSTIHPDKMDPWRHHNLWWNPEPYPSPYPHDAYHLWIQPSDWQHLIDNIDVSIGSRRVEAYDSCIVRRAWQQYLNCTLVYLGTVYETTCRLQGSRWNRPSADTVDVTKWGGTPPTNGHLLAYSYRVDLPAQQQINKAKSIIFNKMWQGCTFYQTPLYNRLADQIGVSSTRTTFGRLWMNGKFLRLMMVLIHGGADWVKEAKKILEKRCIHQSTEDIGDVFNSHGLFGWEGPFGAGNFRVIGTNPDCSQWNQMDIWEYTYGRHTYKYLDYTPIDSLINGLDKNPSAAVLNNTVDFNAFMGYFLLDSFGASWDHAIHNQQVLRRLSDLKWEWLPWDADTMFGEKCSYFTKADCNPWANTETKMKEVFWAAFQPQIQNAMKLMIATVLSTSNLQSMIDAIDAEMNTTVYQLSNNYAPWNQGTTPTGCKNGIKSWLALRTQYYTNQIGAYQGTAAQAQADLAAFSCPVKPTLTKIYNVYTSKPGPTLPPLITYNQIAEPLSATLNWTGSNPTGFPITQYTIQVSLNGAAYTSAGTAKPTASITMNGGATVSVAPGNNYSFRIIATNSQGDSIPSNPRTISIPRNCSWAAWGAWDNCTVSCGGGTTTRTRAQSPTAANGGAECVGNATETNTCNTQNCPIDCVWSAWSPFSNCSQPCGGGASVATRNQTPPAQYGGLPCVGNATDSVPCNTQICMDCAWTAWTWGNCTVTCGGGVMYGTRSQIPGQPGGLPCSGGPTTNQTCNTQPCPIDCAWGQWSQWTCSVLCGGGNATSTRTVQTPAQYGGTNCTGNDTQTMSPCNTQDCSKDCWWGEWSQWSDCTVSCGGGVQTASRNQTPAKPGGIPCTGGPTQTEACNVIACPPGTTPPPGATGGPVNCEWDDWGGWGDCYPCDGNGTQTRYRTKKIQEAYGGLPCDGNTTEVQNCSDCSGNSSGLSTGALIGIIVGAVVGTLVLLAVLSMLYFSSLSQNFEQV